MSDKKSTAVIYYEYNPVTYKFTQLNSEQIIKLADEWRHPAETPEIKKKKAVKEIKEAITNHKNENSHLDSTASKSSKRSTGKPNAKR